MFASMNRAPWMTLALSLALVLPALSQDSAPINTLTDAEKAAGWKVLFNGKDFTGWHNQRQRNL